MFCNVMAELRSLESLLPAGRVLTDPADCVAYSFDNSRRSERPWAVVLAHSEAEIQTLVRWCASEGRALTVRGRGTNTVGATVPEPGGVVLSLERMQKVLEYSPADRSITVEAGCLNQMVQAHCAADGLFWPPDPTSAAYSSIGGNLGCNAGGPRAVRYGTCRDNTLGLRAVLGDGRLIRVGSRTTKSVVGLDLTRLLIGAEGTLGIITAATLKLSPLPQAKRTVRAEFGSVAAAARAVSALLSQPEIPAVCEFLDDSAVGLIRSEVPLQSNTQAILLLEAHGAAEQLGPVCQGWKSSCPVAPTAWLESADPAGVVELWQARKALSPKLRGLAPDKTNEDVVVPVSQIPRLVEAVRALSERYGIPIVCFGHAGNGNLHVNLMYDRANPAHATAHDDCLQAVFSAVMDCGGSLSGEHGIGLSKRDFVGLELDQDTLAAMWAVKKALDPYSILNPSKGLPPLKA